VAKNIKTPSRSDTTKLCAFVPLCLCTFLSNLVNPVNLVRILTVKNSANLCQKFCIFLAISCPKIGRPNKLRKFAQFTFCQKSSEIFRNIQKSTSEIDGNRQKYSKNSLALLLLARNQPIFTQIFQNIQKYPKKRS